MNLRRPLARNVALLLLSTVLAARAPAQPPAPAVARAPRLLPLVRLDALVDARPGVQGAVGVTAATAYNTRLDLVAGLGGVSRPTGWELAGRVDLLGRWLSDPYRRSRWALSAGGGVGLLLEQARGPRPVGILAVGLEAPGTGRWLRGAEVALGGGVRVGVTMRRVRPGRR